MDPTVCVKGSVGCVPPESEGQSVTSNPSHWAARWAEHPHHHHLGITGPPSHSWELPVVFGFLQPSRSKKKLGGNMEPAQALRLPFSPSLPTSPVRSLEWRLPVRSLEWRLPVFLDGRVKSDSTLIFEENGGLFTWPLTQEINNICVALTVYKNEISVILYDFNHTTNSINVKP
jgi:hypothetical protein